MKTPLITLLSLSICSPIAFATETTAPATPVVAVAPAVSAEQQKSKADFDAKVKEMEAQHAAKIKEFEAHRAEQLKKIEAYRAGFDKMSHSYADKMKAAKSAEEMQTIANEHMKSVYEKAGIEAPKRPDMTEMMKQQAAHVEKMKGLYSIKDPAERQKQLMAYQQEQYKHMPTAPAMPNMPAMPTMPNMPTHHMNMNAPQFMQPQNPAQYQQMQQQRANHRKMVHEHQQKMQQDMQQRIVHMEKMMQDMQKQQTAPAPTKAPVATPAPVTPAK